MSRRLWAMAAMIGLVACSAPRRPEAPSRIVPGAVAPPVLLSASAGITLGWLLRADDCLTCDNPARLLRAIQRRYSGDRVGLVMVVVGPASQGPALFAEQERLTVDLRTIPELPAMAGRPETGSPVLYLAAGKVVARWWQYRTTPSADAASWDLPLLFQALDSLAGRRAESAVAGAAFAP